MAEIRAFVIDDEAPARRRIEELLEREPDVEVIGSFERGADAVDALRASPPDLVFLDVQMPDLDGFGVVDQVGPDRMPFTIFVTAYDQHALRAFEVQALDYLLKPFSDERFEASLARARRHLDVASRAQLGEAMAGLLAQHHLEPGDPPDGESADYLDRIVVKSAGRVRFLDVDDIEWIQAAGVYLRLYAGGERHLIRETITRLEQRLDPRRFVRIHRSTIVPLRGIQEMRADRHGDYTVTLTNGTSLRMSRGYRRVLSERLGQSL